MSSVALTQVGKDELKRNYDENGFVVVENLLGIQEIEALKNRLEEIISGRLNHVPEANFDLEPDVLKGKVTPATKMDALRVVRNLSSHDALFLSAAKNQRTLDVVEAILGPNIKIYGDQLLMKPPFYGIEKPYHQDSAYWSIRPMALVTCWLALDEATVENGCLHFIRGSHKLGLIEHGEKWMVGDREDMQVSGSMIDRSKEVAAPLRPGSGSFHHSLTLHRSSPNRSPHRRRGWAVAYMSAESTYGDDYSKKPNYILVRGQEFPGRV